MYETFPTRGIISKNCIQWLVPKIIAKKKVFSLFQKKKRSNSMLLQDSTGIILELNNQGYKIKAVL